MKSRILLAIGLAMTIAACESPTKRYEDKIAQLVKNDAMGFEVNYKSLEFEWIDTLTIESKTMAQYDLVQESKNNIKVPNKMKSGYQYVTGVLGSWLEIDKKYDGKKSKSHTQTLSKFEEMYKTDSIQAILYFLDEADKYIGLKGSPYVYQQSLIEYTQNQKEYERLDNLPQSQVIQYTARNKYTITNPMFNNAKQEVEGYFIFDPDFNIIDRVNLDGHKYLRDVL